MRTVLLVVHPTRPDAVEFAQALIVALQVHGISVASNYPGGFIGAAGMGVDREFEIAVVLGGDGTILRAAELVLGTQIPILGINLGNVGFLAEIDRPTAAALAQSIAEKNYRGEPRLLLQHEVWRENHQVATGWALNEFTIERSHSQMVELFKGPASGDFLILAPHFMFK